MRFENEGRALDRSCVGGFAAFGEARFDQRRRIDETRDPQARGALAAEIVLEPLAIRRLREHARQRVFADAARAGEQQRARHAFAPEHSAQGADHALIAEKFVEAHLFT